MATFLNGKLLLGVPGTITFTTPAGSAITGYVSPNLQGLSAGHKAEVARIPNSSGQTTALIVTDEWIELTFDYIPQGTSDANARASGTLPPILSKAAVAGLPIIQIGAFADGLNTDGSTTQPWIYEGDGGIEGKAKEHWDGKITLRRYVNIASTAAYS